MSPDSAIAIITAYMIGSIPTAYLLVRAIRGIDIRSVGSGNVGATNAGRVLGPRGFLVVFGLDLLKGLLPTLALPEAVRWAGGSQPYALPVLVAAAAILGHNFPVFLRFRGGKGVATSLGAVAALDPIAAGAAVLTFALVLMLFRFVSLASLSAGLAFVGVHFAKTPGPLSARQIGLSVVLLLLLGMLFVRHRKNLGRLITGTEPKVRLGRRGGPPTGRVGGGTLIGLAIGSGAMILLAIAAARAILPAEVRCGPYLLVAADRVHTGHQRADGLAFFDEGRRLAVLCPRYNRMMIYEVTDEPDLALLADVPLAGKPVAVAPAGDRLIVLERPSGDARHLEPAFWQQLSSDGEPIGDPFPVGYDPDDLAILDGGRIVLVLLSGNAEGESNRPDPSLIAVALDAIGEPTIRDTVRLGGPGGDPVKIVLSENQTHAGVLIRDNSDGNAKVVGIDLSRPESPTTTGELHVPDSDWPMLSESGDDAIWVPNPGDRPVAYLPEPSARVGRPRFLLGILPDESGLEAYDLARGESAGVLELRGPANMGQVRPTDLAVSPDRQLAAITDRSGGVHLIAVHQIERSEPTAAIASTDKQSDRR